jgi:N-acetylmuramoyl-L-alanine amidase
MEITSRSAWGSLKTTIPVLNGALPKVYIHHTAGHFPTSVQDEINQMHALQNYAINTKHYTDIDYNFLIGPSGIIYESRGLNHKSAATLGENEVSRSVCFMGNFQGDIPTAQSVAAAADCIKYLINHGDLSPSVEILGHRDNPRHLNATACPGENLYAYIPKIRDLVSQHTPVGDDDMLKARFVRQKGYTNVFVVGGGFPVLHCSGELMKSIETEDPTVPKIFQDNMASMHGLCVQAGLDINDPAQVIPGGSNDKFS